jgi:7,8-dihydroneopterin aldolase/epimerase/oxygenase
MDTIFIRELRLPAWIGMYKHEKLAQQTVELDIEIGIPGTGVFTSARIQDTIDYASVVTRIKSLLATERFGLLEKLADRLAGVILDEFKAPLVRISVIKCGVLREAKRVGVQLERRR